MNRTRHYIGAAVGIAFLVLIFDSKTAVQGAATGVELCIKTVIPSLFPFFVLSILLTRTLQGSLPHPFRLLAAWLRIPEAAASVLIPGFLGGYPVGAQCITTLYRENQLQNQEAQRLLAFCNNAGPSFLFGMVSGFFPELGMIWVLWLIHIAAALMTAMVIPSYAAKTSDLSLNNKRESDGTDIVIAAAKAMASVCCWVIIFRTWIAFLKKWLFWRFPKALQVLLMGLLELTNGCCALSEVSDVTVRFVLCSCMLAFGGFCVFAQTASVTQGLSLRMFFQGKVLQTLFSFLLSSAIMLEKGWICAVVASVLVLILRKVQKRYSIPDAVPV